MTDQEQARRQMDLFKTQTVIRILNEHKPLLVLDGIDEVGEDEVKAKLLKNINEISLSCPHARFILTTRKGDDRFHIENTRRFELAPLDSDQINDFSENWLGKDPARQFLDQLQKSSVFDAAKRPLTLAILCAIYERENRIPEKSKSIYKKIVNLLILEWNVENQINRASKFNGFEPDRKKEFLENLAFDLTVRFNKTQFNTNDLEKCYRNLYVKFNLPLFEIKEVVNEIEIHNGLLNQINFETFEFAHKSFQEYLVAEYLVRLPSLPLNENLAKIPSEMALAITLSSEATEYLITFIEQFLLINPIDLTFFKLFCSRLLIESPDFVESEKLGALLIKLNDRYSEIIISFFARKALEAKSMRNIMDESFHNLLSIDNILLSLKFYSKDFGLFKEEIHDGFIKTKFLRSPDFDLIPNELIISKSFLTAFTSS